MKMEATNKSKAISTETLKDGLLDYLAKWAILKPAFVKSMTYKRSFLAPCIDQLVQEYPEIEEIINDSIKRAIKILIANLGQKASEELAEESTRIALANYSSKLSFRAYLHCFYKIRIADSLLYPKEDFYYKPQKLARWLGMYWNRMSSERIEFEKALKAQEDAKVGSAMSEETRNKINELAKRLAVK